MKGNSGWDQLANIEKLISVFWITLPFHLFIISQQYTAHTVAGSLSMPHDGVGGTVVAALTDQH